MRIVRKPSGKSKGNTTACGRDFKNCHIEGYELQRLRENSFGR
jgi:hypothetical protein